MDTMAKKIVEAAAQPMDIGDTKVQVTASLGIASYPDDGATANDLLAAADRAMYAAKRAGGGDYAHAVTQVQEPPSA
jgi:diguanylate cyclase (GGDEF)-like protein